MDLDFVFEESQWQLALKAYKKGERISSAQLLTLLEEAEEAQVEEALDCLLEREISLDVSDLPKFSASDALAARLALEEKLVRQDQLPEGLEENENYMLENQIYSGGYLMYRGLPLINGEENYSKILQLHKVTEKGVE